MCKFALTLPRGFESRMRHPKWDKANFDAIYPPLPSYPSPHWEDTIGREGMQQPKVDSPPLPSSLILPVSGHFKVCKERSREGRKGEGTPLDA